MFGRTNAGGGGASPFAFIFATYPAGSVCTCTDGSRTLKLKDTSGYGVFYPPYAGTWTVTATNGDSEASQTVEITKEGESVSVELSYSTYLYKNGEELVSWPNTSRVVAWSGTTGIGAYAATKHTDRMSFPDIGAKYTSCVANSELVNFDKINTLKFTINKLNSTPSQCMFSLTDDNGNKTVDQMRNSQCVAGIWYGQPTPLTTVGEQVISLDVSAVTGSHYVYVCHVVGALSDGPGGFDLLSVEVE